ncbi:hypothetical protein [Hafnia phage Pocis76]|uniref:Uncharacterized protein n=1 Tax=Hafnia phage Pocis76 TaxID=2831174 RepID=A0A8E7FMZ7_9CAUD|nr:hypothetical protein [Hafnia phage Pocis76]
MEYTSKDYCENLRILGRKLAEGEIEEYRLNITELMEHMNPDDYHKVTKSMSYSRVIINRVPEVKAVGSISIRVDEDELSKYYVFTLRKGQKKRIINEDDLPHVRQVAVNKALRRLIACPPRITDLSEEEMRGAAKVIERYIEVMQSMMKGEDDDE